MNKALKYLFMNKCFFWLTYEFETQEDLQIKANAGRQSKYDN